MKKYLVFLIGFGVLFMLFQVISGLILTASYTPTTPNFSTPDNSSSVIVSGVNTTSIIPTILIATLAYFISQKTSKRSEN